MQRAELLEWRFLRTTDPCNPLRYGGHHAWSRIYEYPLAAKIISDYIQENSIIRPRIHNTCCGFSDLHLKFANELELLGSVVNSDIRSESNVLFHSFVEYDITRDSREYDSLSNTFDVIVNISSIEEIDFWPVSIIDNLMGQLRPGGLFIATIDYTWLDPLLQLPLATDNIPKLLQHRIPQYSKNMILTTECCRRIGELYKTFGCPHLLESAYPTGEILKDSSSILNGANSHEPNENCIFLSPLLLVLKVLN